MLCRHDMKILVHLAARKQKLVQGIFARCGHSPNDSASGLSALGYGLDKKIGYTNTVFEKHASPATIVGVCDEYHVMLSSFDVYI